MARNLRLAGDNALAELKQSMRSRMRDDEARHRINASDAGAPARKDGEQTPKPRTPAAAAPINGAKADTEGGPGRSPGARASGAASSPTKYRNKPTNGYASKREAKRAAELRTLEAVGDIRNLREQVPFLLIPKQDGERACSYTADFVYDERIQAAWPDEGWASVTEDVKGVRTEAYRIKRKLMLFVHGIRIRET